VRKTKESTHACKQTNTLIDKRF